VSPCSLGTAITKSVAGNTVYLRGGVYVGTFDFSRSGTSAAPIVYTNYPGERATIENPNVNDPNGVLDTVIISGDYVRVIGLEIRNSTTQRTTCNRPGAVLMRGVGTKLINNIIHDNGNSVFMSSGATNAEAYGNLIYNNGWIADGTTTTPGCVLGVGPTGHGIYPQNLSAASPKLMRDNIILFQWGYGIHGFSTHTDVLHGFSLDGNAIASSGYGAPNPNIFFGGGVNQPLEALRITNNYTYNGEVQIGYADNTANLDATVTDNTFGLVNGQVHFRNFNTVQFRRNLIWSSSVAPGGSSVNLNLSNVGRTFDWNANNYYNGLSSPFLIDGDNWYNLPGWKTRTGFDAASSAVTGSPPGTNVFVRPNAYNPKLTNIIVYNWGGQSTASINVSAVLSPGDVYELRNAQDYYSAPVLRGTYNGSNLVVPMALSVAQPVGGVAQTSTSPKFNVLILIKQ
jgi:hypothetical protein